MADQSYRTIHCVEVRTIHDGVLSTAVITHGVPAEARRLYKQAINKLTTEKTPGIVTLRDEQHQLLASHGVPPTQAPQGRTYFRNSNGKLKRKW